MRRHVRVHVLHRSIPLQCWTYLVACPEGAILVDPGSGICEKAIDEELRRLGFSPGDIPFILLTHCHVDHAGGAHRYQGRGAKLVASARTAGKLESLPHQVWYEYPEHVVATKVDLTPEDGEILRLCGAEIRAVHTPGHTSGSTSYLVETEDGLTLLAGDLLEGDGGLAWAGSEDFSEETTLASIEKLLAYAPARAFWGHGIVEGAATEWLERARALGRAGQWKRVTERHPEFRPPPPENEPRG